jgi:hypothetical protein
MRTHSKHSLDIHAVGLTTYKAHGEAAEAAFLAKAAGLGFGVAKPWGDSERYDFIVDSGHNFWRVQVKSTRSRVRSGYALRTSGQNNTLYDSTQIDFVVAYIVMEDVWYVIPVEAVGPRSTLHLYPRGGGKSGLENYREAWCLMACPRTEDGPSQVLVERRCQRCPG